MIFITRNEMETPVVTYRLPMNEVLRLLSEADTTTWSMEEQLIVATAISNMVKTIAPIVLRNASKDEKNNVFI